MVQGVVDQVAHHRGEVVAVHGHTNIVLTSRTDTGVAVGALDPEGLAQIGVVPLQVQQQRPQPALPCPAGLHDVGAGQFQQAGYQPGQPVAVLGDVIEKAGASVFVHARRMIAQQLDRALNAGQRGLEFVADVGGKLADIGRAGFEGVGHGDHRLGQFGDIGSDGVAQRPDPAAAPIGDLLGLVDQPRHRADDGRSEEQRQRHRHHHQQHAADDKDPHFAAQRIAQGRRGPSQQHPANHTVVEDDWGCDMHTDARRPLEGVETALALGKFLLLPQQRDDLTPQRALDLGQVGDALADILRRAGHDRTAVIEHADRRQGEVVGLDDHRADVLPHGLGQPMGGRRRPARHRRGR